MDRDAVVVACVARRLRRADLAAPAAALATQRAQGAVLAAARFPRGVALGERVVIARAPGVKLRGEHPVRGGAARLHLASDDGGERPRPHGHDGRDGEEPRRGERIGQRRAEPHGAAERRGVQQWKSGGETRKHSVYLPPALSERLMAACNAEGMKPSKAFELAVEAWLEGRQRPR